MYSLRSYGLFRKKYLPIKIENVYQCAYNIYESNLLYYAILWKSLIFKIRPTLKIAFDSFVGGKDVIMFNWYDI